MTRAVLSQKAYADLGGIWDATAARWGDAQADRYVRDIWRAIEMVAADPRRANPCDDIRPGYRKYLVGSHVLFFRQIDGVIDIVRILHARMDFDRHF